MCRTLLVLLCEARCVHSVVVAVGAGMLSLRVVLTTYPVLLDLPVIGGTDPSAGLDPKVTVSRLSS